MLIKNVIIGMISREMISEQDRDTRRLTQVEAVCSKRSTRRLPANSQPGSLVLFQPFGVSILPILGREKSDLKRLGRLAELKVARNQRVIAERAREDEIPTTMCETV